MGKEIATVKSLWKSLYDDLCILSSAYQRKIDKLDAAINSLPDTDDSDTALRWSAELPTVEGWYWVAFAGAPLVYWIEYREGRLRATIDHFNWTDVTDFATGNYQFAGPIPEPAAIAAEGGRSDG